MDCCVHSDAVSPVDEVEDDAEVVLVVIALILPHSLSQPACRARRELARRSTATVFTNL
jgi:hypothetical protein